MRLRKIMAAGVATLALATGVAGISSQKVEASSGLIYEVNNEKPIVGVWVEVHGGRSGWATVRKTPGYQSKVSWSYNTQGKPFELHIGVGGTSQNWEKSVHTKVFSSDTNGGTINISNTNWWTSFFGPTVQYAGMP